MVGFQTGEIIIGVWVMVETIQLMVPLVLGNERLKNRMEDKNRQAREQKEDEHIQATTPTTNTNNN